MRTFEERFTAWVDGRLEGAELEAFEREIEAHPEALAEREGARAMSRLLRAHAAPAPLRNADFFNHQLMERIRAERGREPLPARAGGGWLALLCGLPGMALAGACLLLLSGVLYLAVPHGREPLMSGEPAAPLVVQRHPAAQNILNARADDPGVTATSFRSKKNHANVLWLDGLNYIPRDHKLK